MHCASDMLINAFTNADKTTTLSFLSEIDNWIAGHYKANRSKSKLLKVIEHIKYSNLAETSLKEIKKQTGNDKLTTSNLSFELFKDPLFFEHVRDVMGKEYCNRHMVCLFRDEHCSETSKANKKTYLIVLQAIRIYAFLHDVGHLPFSHMFETALGKLAFGNYSNSQSKNMDLINSIFENNVNDLHETIGYRIIDFLLEEAIHDNLVLYCDTKDIRFFYRSHVLEIIQLLVNNIITTSNNRLFYALHQIVDGSVDADRIDFTIRQLANSGLNSGSSDVSRVIKMLKLIVTPEPIRYEIVPSIQSIYDLEGIFKDRFTLYKLIVNHHAVRRTDCVLQTAIEETILLGGEDEISEIEFGFIISTMADVLATILGIVTKDEDIFNARSSMYKYSQINDHWLMSKLNQLFIPRLLAERGSPLRKERLTYLLEELFHDTRVFKSLWKRFDEYNDFVCKLGIFTYNTHILKELGIDLEGNQYDKKQMEPCPLDTALLIGKEVINKLFDVTKDKSNLLVVVEKKLNASGEDYLLVPVKLKSGIKDVKVYFKNDSKNLEDFNNVSTLPRALNEEVDKFIRFFVYYYEPDKNNLSTTEDMLKRELDKNTRIDFVLESITSSIKERDGKEKM
jgi:HD superfamily phosphohydrolase